MKKKSKNRLLIYAHYYYPDVAATGQLLMELAEGLSPQFDVQVICAVPSYTGVVEDRYRNKWFYKEEIHGIKVLRVRVPAFSKRNKRSRIKNIVAYAVRSMLATFIVGRQDYVLSISQPPVLGGLLGVWGGFWKHAKFIYNIQDFNPEQIIAVGYSQNRMLLNLMMWLDCFCCRQADKIILVGHDMEETLQKRFAGKKIPDYTVINNWINEKEIYPLPEDDKGVLSFKKKYDLEDKFVIMYSGNMGLYYDLVNLIKVLKQYRKGYTSDGALEEGIRTVKGREVVFAFVGAGSVLSQLILYKEEHHIDNIVFIPYQNKEELIYSLNAADVHWCVNAIGLKGVSFPSKCYGIMAAGKPVLGVLEKGSGAREMVERADCGLCCDPGDYGSVARLIEWFVMQDGSDRMLEMGMNGRRYLGQFLTRKEAFTRYQEEITGCIRTKNPLQAEQNEKKVENTIIDQKLTLYNSPTSYGLAAGLERMGRSGNEQ